MMKKYLIIAAAVLLISAGLSQAQANEYNEPITSADIAVQKALEFTGFERLEGFSADGRTDAQLVTLTGDRTPFVSRLINDRQVWQVSLSEVPLSEIRPGNRGRPIRATFEVLIDPDNGKLLKIRSEFVDTTYALPRDQEPEVGPPKKLGTGDNAPTLHLIPSGPDPKEKEPIFEERGFAGLPEVAPCAFLDVLRNSWVNAEKGIRIEAAYVLQKPKGEKKALPLWKVWVIGYPDIVNETDNSVVTTEPPPTAVTRTYLLTQLVTADGPLGECRSVEEAQWQTMSGDLPPGTRRLYRIYRLSGRHYGDDRSAISIGFHSSGELLVTDPAGRRTGVDALTGQSFEEIPRASYYENSIGPPDGSGPVMSSKRFDTQRPMSGEYMLTVTGTEDDNYGLSVNRYDVNNESQRSSTSDIPITSGKVHNYTLSFDRIAATKSTITGGFDGGGEQTPEANRLQSYVNVSASNTRLPAGTDTFGLIIIYGKVAAPESFTATLNGSDVSGSFAPKAGGYEIVSIPLLAGENTLLLSIGGAGVQDTDSLVFIVE